MVTKFEENLNFGKIAEKEIEKYFLNKKYNIIRSYDYTGDENNKSPKMFSKIKNRVLPDLDISKNGKRFWVEIKHYSYAPLNRKLNKYVHGIKRRHYNDYLDIEIITNNEVYLFIKEDQDNVILYKKLNELTIYKCQCKNCMNNNFENCLAPLKDGIYFDKNEFNILKIGEK